MTKYTNLSSSGPPFHLSSLAVFWIASPAAAAPAATLPVVLLAAAAVLPPSCARKDAGPPALYTPFPRVVRVLISLIPVIPSLVLARHADCTQDNPQRNLPNGTITVEILAMYRHSITNA